MNFYIDGEKKKIVVDDYIPVFRHSNEPIFCKLNKKTKNIWPLILEKAWAKLLGSYQKTSGGLPTYPFDVLLGVPCEDIDIFSELNDIKEDEQDSDFDDSSFITTPCFDIEEISKNKSFLIWEKLLSYFHENYLVTCSISSEILSSSALKKELDDLGLVTFHAYACIFFQEFTVQGNKVVRLVKLRNPWGKLKNKNFKGTLIKNNYYKSQEIIANAQINDEGEFILEYDEFKRFFSYIYVSKIKNNFNCYIDAIYNSCEDNKQFKCKIYQYSFYLFK